ncbi:hypothetical protein, partial [Bifidobacterium choerinum]|uniref:hypothetical protein n=1 Tax=Bifidobacterium choerinum TaxID=35760 RepID=UPI000556B089
MARIGATACAPRIADDAAVATRRPASSRAAYVQYSPTAATSPLAMTTVAPCAQASASASSTRVRSRTSKPASGSSRAMTGVRAASAA